MSESDFELLKQERNQAMRIANSNAIACVELEGKCEEYLDKIARLEAECAALKADAERYRWLREFSQTDHNVDVDGAGPVLVFDDEFQDNWRDRTDASIDAAMQAGEKS